MNTFEMDLVLAVISREVCNILYALDVLLNAAEHCSSSLDIAVRKVCDFQLLFVIWRPSWGFVLSEDSLLGQLFLETFLFTGFLVDLLFIATFHNLVGRGCCLRGRMEGMYWRW